MLCSNNKLITSRIIVKESNLEGITQALSLRKENKWSGILQFVLRITSRDTANPKLLGIKSVL